MKPLLVLAVMGLVWSAPAQSMNSWINPASGRWEDAYWSLGILPSASQSVLVTNAGYKAVGIFNSTTADKPASLTVGNLQISAPTNAASTVLLNFTGLNTPLKILNDCRIDNGGTLQNESGEFEVDGAAGGGLSITGSGRLIQDGGQTIATVPIHVRGGLISCTNGNMTLGDLTIGDTNMQGFAHMIQDGGSIAAQTLDVRDGDYTLARGILYAINGTTLSSSAFYQSAGTNFGDLNLFGGALYDSSGGFNQGNVVNVGSPAKITLEGGTMSMSFVDVSGDENYPGSPAFWLRSGQLMCGTLNIGGNGVFQQDGGTCTLTNNLDLRGFTFMTSRGLLITHAQYRLQGGTFSGPSITVEENSQFDQLGGTTLLTGGLSTVTGNYSLTNGQLETTSTGVGFGTTFLQNGGTHRVAGVLSVTGDYLLNSGKVSVDGFYTRGLLGLKDIYGVASFINTGLTDFGGTMQCGISNVALGQIRLSTNATIEFIASDASVYCANSSGLPWTSGAWLVISNWNHFAGAPNHIYFGTGPNSLSSSQVAQIQFVNPGGLSPGTYSAQILPSGEVVPVGSLILRTAHGGSLLVLDWAGNYQLLSATNIAGPYTPVPGASSPWTNFVKYPQEFFRLQAQSGTSESALR